MQQRHIAREPHEACRLGFAGHAPLPVAARALQLLPRELEQEVEELIVPARRIRGPGPFHAAGEGICSLASAAFARPRVGHILLRRGSRPRGAGAMAFAEGVAAANESHGLGVVHAHATKGVPDVLGTLRGIRVYSPGPIRLLRHGTFRIQVDKPHRGAPQRALAGAVHRAGRVLLLLWAGPQVQALCAVWGVDPASAVLGHWAAHGLDGCGASQDKEVTPAEAVPVLLLDGPQQPAGLVQVRVVCPAAFWLEALAAPAAAPVPVGLAVAAGAMPRQPDEERPIVPEVCGPALLRVGEGCLQVRDHRLEVEGLQRGVVSWQLRHCSVVLGRGPELQSGARAQGAQRQQRPANHSGHGKTRGSDPCACRVLR